jgi:phage baseplate assembly protein W
MTDGPVTHGFLGQGWAFPPRFDAQSGSAGMCASESDIVDSLRILFSTRTGERIMQPDYGCRLKDLVFEPMDTRTRVAIEVAVTRAVQFFEARINLDRVQVSASDWPEGRLEIMLTYVIRETNSRHNMVFPFYIQEGTLISDKPAAIGA